MTTVRELIEALEKLPPETEVLIEGGFVGIHLPTPDEVRVEADESKWVTLS